MITVLFFNGSLHEGQGYDDAELLSLRDTIHQWIDVGNSPVEKSVSAQLQNYSSVLGNHEWGVIQRTWSDLITSEIILVLDRFTSVELNTLLPAIEQLQRNSHWAMLGGRGVDWVPSEKIPRWFSRWKHHYQTGTVSLSSEEISQTKFLFTPGLLLRKKWLTNCVEAFPKKQSFSIEFLQSACAAMHVTRYYSEDYFFERCIPENLLEEKENRALNIARLQRRNEFPYPDYYFSWSKAPFRFKVSMTLMVLLLKKIHHLSRTQILQLWLDTPLFNKTSLTPFLMLRQLFRKKEQFQGKINLFIVGEQKCGTSTLHQLLVKSSNGQIIGHENGKEVHFWDSPMQRSKREIKRYERGFWSFIDGENPVYALDSTPRYAWAKRGIGLERIIKYNPEAKLIYITRNPVKRFISAYKMFDERNAKSRTTINHMKGVSDFDSFTNKHLNPNRQVFERGLYRNMMSRIKASTPNHLFLKLEDFKDPDFIYDQLEKFLGIQLDRIPIMQSNQKSARESIHPDTIERIRLAYKDHPDNIYEL